MQSLWCALAAQQEKERELATTSLEFELLLKRTPIYTPPPLFFFVYIRARFRFALTDGNLTAQSMGNHGNWRSN